MSKKRKVEVDEDDIVIVVSPKQDVDNEWIHETNVHFSKKHFKNEKAAIAVSELCRAMVGFSYAATNDDILFYSGNCYLRYFYYSFKMYFVKKHLLFLSFCN